MFRCYLLSIAALARMKTCGDTSLILLRAALAGSGKKLCSLGPSCQVLRDGDSSNLDKCMRLTGSHLVSGSTDEPAWGPERSCDNAGASLPSKAMSSDSGIVESCYIKSRGSED